MSTAAGLLVTAALVGAAGVAALLVGRRTSGAAAVLAGLFLAVVAPATTLFPSSLQTWAGVAAAPLVAAAAALTLSEPRWEWLPIAAGGALAGPGRVLLTDPFRDAACTDDCVTNPLGLASRPEGAAALHLSGTALLVVGVVLLAAHLRHDVASVAAGGAVVVSALAGVDAAPTLLTLGPLAAAVLLAERARRVLLARGRVQALVDALGGGPADVATLLRRQWGDPDVAVYHRISSGAFVDGTGRPEPISEPGTGTAVAEVTADGQVVTRIHHDARRAEAGAVGVALDERARLALENDRLAADVAARARVLTDARTRLVRTADAQRRALEHDLHDSAQQHVLALGLELQLAGSGPGDDLADVLDACRRETACALEGLREISHGIYPADLESGGLVHALHELALRAHVPVDVQAMPGAEPSADVARATYAVADDAVSRASGPLRISVRPEGALLVVEIRGPSAPPREPVVDRVAAFGGTVRTSPESWEVMLPCVWS